MPDDTNLFCVFIAEDSGEYGASDYTSDTFTINGPLNAGLSVAKWQLRIHSRTGLRLACSTAG